MIIYHSNSEKYQYNTCIFNRWFILYFLFPFQNYTNMLLCLLSCIWWCFSNSVWYFGLAFILYLGYNFFALLKSFAEANQFPQKRKFCPSPTKLHGKTVLITGKYWSIFLVIFNLNFEILLKRDVHRIKIYLNLSLSPRYTLSW